MTPDAGPRPPRRRQQARRIASERALIDAFESMLLRHGPGRVGVNDVLQSAGVGKRLLYKYFGDLNGLARAWAQSRRDPLDLERRMPALRRRLSRLPRHERLAAVTVDFATQLRAHPWALQVMLAELGGDEALARSSQAVRREIGSTHERLLLQSEALNSPKDVPLALVLHAAATQLALRAKFAPVWNGIDLSSQAGWRATMTMLTTVASDAIHAREEMPRLRPPSRQKRRTRIRRAV